MDKIDRLVEENIGLAYYVGKKYAYCVGYEEAVAIASLGLVKAANSFDEALGNTFATYATRCMHNEIRMELRRINKRPKTISLDAPLGDTYNSDCFMDYLEDPTCTEEVILDHSVASSALDLLSTFSILEQQVITLRFLHGKTQAIAASELNLSQSYISRLERTCASKLRSKLNGGLVCN